MSSYKKYFQKAIQSNYPNKYENVLTKTAANYRKISADINFAKTSKNPLDKRLDFCAYFLALIMVLDKEEKDFIDIRRICLEIAAEYVKPKNKLQALLKRLSPKLVDTWLAKILLNKLNHRLNKNVNREGFVANIITNKSETYGFGYGIDIIECGICKLFKRHKYENYSSILCEVDELTSALTGLELIRTGTIANGALKCDFRFRKKKPNKSTSAPIPKRFTNDVCSF